MKSPSPQGPASGSLVHPPLWGTLCGLASAVGYTCANAFLRSVDDYDPFWVSAVKALPTIVAMSPVIAWMALRGQRVWPGANLLA
ncbi:MAG TPA: hypothetical protein VFV87_08690, partial [Pirellulaceae bacterium]|nr:hypothetical protein [Pirellulaceae bacterium]